MSIWSQLDDRYRECPDLVGSGVQDEEIAQASMALGVQFSEGYRTFLRKYGAGIVRSLPVYGLSSAVALGDLTVVTASQRFREDGWPGVERWYVVSMDGAGNPIGVDPEGAVWISNHDGGGIVALAPSFEEFVARELDP